MASLQQQLIIFVVLIDITWETNQKYDNIKEINEINECSIDENNNLIHGMTPKQMNEISLIMTLKTDGYFFESFGECLMTDYNVNIDKIINNEIDIEIEEKRDEERGEKEEKEEIKDGKTNSFNFAAFDSGATVLSKSEGIKSAKSILINRGDKYMMMPCELESKWFVIQLSEDIVIDRMEISNFEHYSSNFKHIRIYAQYENHNDDGIDNDDDDGDNKKNKKIWELISDFILEKKSKNTIQFTEKHWVRSLKIDILSYYGNEYYCTVTQIKVFGSTMLPHWKQELLSHFDEVEQIKQNITNNTNNVNITNTNGRHITDITVFNKNGDRKKQEYTNKQESVFTILTKRIASLEVNLTKQQMQVSNLLNLFNQIDGELNHKFKEYQLNLTNHILFQSYGISMMLKTIKNNNNNNNGNNTNNTANNTDNNDNINKYVLSWKRQQQLQQIENYIENILFMITNLYWIGLIIIISQIIIIICFIYYFCGKRSKHSNNHKHRITPSSNRSNGSTRNRFTFNRTMSNSSIQFKRNHRKKFKK